jgi:hypothetical protein
MIRALAHDKHGKPIVILGVDAENLSRLQDDKPIQVNLRYLDPTSNKATELPNIDIVIFFDDGVTGVELMRKLLAKPLT